MTRRLAVLIGLTLAPAVAEARNLTSADGPGGTYDLIRRNYTTELPDCGHMVDHITEAFDDELKKNVFVFHAHVNQDDDRCGATDRQRTEIRARAADIVAQNGETVYYRWKFKLATGFQGSPSFTHIMQIKSDQAAPVMTLTPRTSTLAIDGRIGARGATALSKFIGVWVVAEMKVVYGNGGSVALRIRRISNGEVLFDYSGGADTWDDGASGHDFKAGIYRSLNNRGMLRDEQVRFADFCASKMSAADCEDGAAPPPPPPSDGGAAPDMGGGDAGGTGGSGGVGGAGGSGGGSSGTGGAGGSGGASAGSGGSGGSGTSGSGGSSSGTGGSSSSGGSGGSGSGGSGSGGSTGSGGSGTRPPRPDSSAGTGGSGASEPAPAGCSCNVGASGGAPGGLAAGLVLVGLVLGLARGRRR
jgi:hypothetical protein